jgi:hypothetical protein
VPVTNFNQWISQRTQPVYLIAREKNRPEMEAVVGNQKNDIKPLTPPYIGVLLTAP